MLNTEKGIREMQKNHAKAIKGLSIAAIVISAVLIVCYILGMVMVGVTGTYAADYLSSYAYDDMFDNHYEYHSFDADDAAAFSAIMGVVNVALAFCVIGVVVCLIGGIIALRNYDKPEKLGAVFGWSIAGAILGFVATGVILTVLFVIIAVFANSDKKLYQSGMYYAMNQPYAQAQGYQTPVYAMPVVDAAPMQSVPAQQPVVPADAYQAQPSAPVAGQQYAQQASQQVQDAEVQAVPAQQPVQVSQQPAPEQAVSVAVDEGVAVVRDDSGSLQDITVAEGSIVIPQEAIQAQSQDGAVSQSNDDNADATPNA